MPLTGTYSWSEKEESIRVVIPLKGCAPAKVDIFCTPSTLKVNYSPYIVDLVLCGAINAVKHKATVKEGTLFVTLFKQAPSEVLWGKLVASEEDAAELRAKGLVEHESLQTELDQQRRDRRIDDERFALRKQMGLDESERSRLENLKAEEKATAEEAMYKTFADMQEQQRSTSSATTTATAAAPASTKTAVATPAPATTTAAPSKTIFDKFLDTDDIDEDEPVPEGKSSGTTPLAADASVLASGCRVEELMTSDDEDEDKGKDERAGKNDASAKAATGRPPDQRDLDLAVYDDDDQHTNLRFVPPPRSINLAGATGQGQGQGQNGGDDSASSGGTGGARLGVSFTPRLFPTPMRESKQAEEADWILKNRKHLKKHAVFGKRLGDVSEEDPTWLKAKGDDFFRGGDARSAISAYSAAIDANEGLTSCYANRSACYLKLGFFGDCRSDCSTAIAQMEAEAEASGGEGPPVTSLAAQTRNSLHKLLLRRAIAGCHLGDFGAAIADQSRVLSAVEALHSLGVDTGGLLPAPLMADLHRLRLLVDVDALKKEGDALVAESRLQEARAKYDAVLALLPFHVGCLSNRAACRLAEGDTEGCVVDCTAAMGLLEVEPASAGAVLGGGGGGGGGGGVGGAATVTGAGAGGALNMLVSVLPPAGSAKRLQWVTRTVARRGQALAMLGRWEEAVRDYRQAAVLNQGDAALQADLQAVVKAAADAGVGVGAGVDSVKV